MLRARILLATLLLPAAHAQTTTYAVYDVTFDATWSDTTHPNAYPNNAHFSPLIGGTHAPGVHFWEEGDLASPGMESMAETGGTSILKNEVQVQIDAGLAGEVIQGPGVNSPGQVSTSLTVTDEFPLATVVTMIAPSPDWFVGVDGVALRVNDQWLGSVVVDLYAWDAGTDSGMFFTSGNQDTDPQEPIALMTNGPFFGQVPLGTFTFTLVDDCSPVEYCTPADGSANNLATISATSCDLADEVRIDLAGGPAGQFAYLLVGNGSGVVSQPPGSVGDLCVTGGACLGRYALDIGPITDAGTFSSALSDSLSGGAGYGIPTCGGAFQSGETWNFQYWHRQPMGQPSTFSSALAVTFL